MTYREIAAILNISDTAVRKIEKKALKKMRKVIGFSSVLEMVEFSHD